MSTALALDFDEQDIQHASFEAQPTSLFENADDLPPRLPARPQSGCLALLTAILENLFFTKANALKAARGGKGSRNAPRQLARDAEWVADESEDPFSFKWICAHLGLDPALVRARYGGKLS